MYKLIKYIELDFNMCAIFEIPIILCQKLPDKITSYT